MFTGLVQAVGTVKLLEKGVLHLDSPESFAPLPDPVGLGESIAVNGCCLTSIAAGELIFKLSGETLRRSALGALQPGTPVNLERSMRASDRFGGHFVQGHVDAVGRLERIDQSEGSSVFKFSGPPEYDRYLVDKGSIAVDGVSLTVVSPKDGGFEAWLIPHTLAATNLGSLKRGAQVNLEYDAIAKHLEKLAAPTMRRKL